MDTLIKGNYFFKFFISLSACNNSSCDETKCTLKLSSFNCFFAWSFSSISFSDQLEQEQRNAQIAKNAKLIFFIVYYFYLFSFFLRKALGMTLEAGPAYCGVLSSSIAITLCDAVMRVSFTFSRQNQLLGHKRFSCAVFSSAKIVNYSYF